MLIWGINCGKCLTTRDSNKDSCSLLWHISALCASSWQSVTNLTKSQLQTKARWWARLCYIPKGLCLSSSIRCDWEENPRLSICPWKTRVLLIHDNLVEMDLAKVTSVAKYRAVLIKRDAASVSVLVHVQRPLDLSAKDRPQVRQEALKHLQNFLWKTVFDSNRPKEQVSTSVCLPPVSLFSPSFFLSSL